MGNKLKLTYLHHYMRTETTGKSLNLVSYVCTYGNTITGCRIRMPDPHTECRIRTYGKGALCGRYCRKILVKE